MYEKCVKCDHLGKDCIPNLYAMNIGEIRDFARKLKEEKGWSNAHLAEVSGVPKGTIDSNFPKNGKNSDVNNSTFSPILCALIGSNMQEMICNNFSESNKLLEEKVILLERENEELNRIMEDTKKEYNSRIEYLKKHIKYKEKIIAVLIVISCILLVFIMFGIVVDWQYSDIGFFWR